MVGAVVLPSLAVLGLWATRSPAPPTTTPTASTLAVLGPLEPAEFLTAYKRSRTSDFAADGQLTRNRGTEQTVVFVRQARDGPRAIDEVGAIAIIKDGETLRRCELIEGRVLCTDPEPAPTAEQETAAARALLAGPDPVYELYEPLPEDKAQATEGLAASSMCWTILQTDPTKSGLFGDETTLCFDLDTGAVASRVTRTGTATERFEATSLRSDVLPADLEPTGN